MPSKRYEKSSGQYFFGFFFNFLQKFRVSVQPLPQPFCLKIGGANLNIPQYEEEQKQNAQTDETLAIMRNHRM
jgi:hypothetical protein